MEMESTSPLLPILLVVLVVVLVVALVIFLVIYANKKAAERTRAMQQAAATLGWAFTAEASFEMIPGLERHHLFSQGHAKKIYNMMYGMVDEARAAIFDYTYTVGHGKHSTTYNQSVIYFQSERLSLPFFSLRPEGFGHKLISALGYQDIDFGNRPTFSSKYLLRGEDEQAIRHTFQDQVLAYYENNLKLCTDGGGNEVFFYQQHVRMKPLNARAFLDWGLTMLKLFQRQW
ncbi:MAG TPA: hypothetical protein VF658_19020 [Pyrinomonadaceae bacterium]|jgi:hypothetical protein